MPRFFKESMGFLTKKEINHRFRLFRSLLVNTLIFAGCCVCLVLAFFWLMRTEGEQDLAKQNRAEGIGNWVGIWMLP